MSHPVLEVGCRVRYDQRIWTVAVLEGSKVTLVTDDGAAAAVLLPYLFTDPDFEVVGGDPVPKIPPFSLLDALPPEARGRALAWERHVREVETGFPGAPGVGAPHPDYDPAVRSVAQREEAKAVELTAAGWVASVGTVRRMRSRYRSGGLWGLVDGRVVKERSRLGRADERVVAAVVRVLEGQRDRSSGTLTRLRRQVGWALEEEFGAGVVEVPPPSTFNRLVHTLADGQGLLGSAAQRRRHSSRPAPPFRVTMALRPGEVVMLDSTPLDVLAVLDDGVVGRLELSVALDVATRSICAAVLRPAGTRSVDAAMLLAQMVAPMAMRPGWDEALSMRRSVIPYERLVVLDARLEGAAARPVIMPEMIVVDQGRVYVSETFVRACGSLGVSVQPAPPGNGPAKGNVERTFRSIGSGFSQYVAGYTGPDVTQRGSATDGEACWSLAQLRELLEEWVVVGWQERKHGALRHPLMPKVCVSPNEMWAALVSVTGHVPVPLKADDYIELLETRWLAVNDYGIRFDYRTYDLDHPGLNDCRRRRSVREDQGGRWEVRYNPYDPNQVWIRLPAGWVEVPWVHRTSVSLPFTAFTWNHVRRTVERREGREEHEAVLARALDDLLRRASNGLGSKRERMVAARAHATAQLTDTDPATVQPVGSAAPMASFGLPGLFAAPTEPGWDEEEEDIDEDWQDDPRWGEDKGPSEAQPSQAADGNVLGSAENSGLFRAGAPASPVPVPRPVPGTGHSPVDIRQGPVGARSASAVTYDPFQEAQAWTTR